MGLIILILVVILIIWLFSTSGGAKIKCDHCGKKFAISAKNYTAWQGGGKKCVKCGKCVNI